MMTPAEVFARRLRAAREARGVGRTELARRMSACAPEEVTRDVVSAIENDRRKTVTLDQVLAAAVALNVSPLTLVAPHDDTTTVELGPDVVFPAAHLRAWFRGSRPAEGGDPVAYFARDVSPWLDERERLRALRDCMVSMDQWPDGLTEGDRDGD